MGQNCEGDYDDRVLRALGIRVSRPLNVIMSLLNSEEIERLRIGVVEICREE